MCVWGGGAFGWGPSFCGGEGFTGVECFVGGGGGGGGVAFFSPATLAYETPATTLPEAGSTFHPQRALYFFAEPFSCTFWASA